jgi:hypothetical protein
MVLTRRTPPAPVQKTRRRPNTKGKASTAEVHAASLKAGSATASWTVPTPRTRRPVGVGAGVLLGSSDVETSALRKTGSVMESLTA